MKHSKMIAASFAALLNPLAGIAASLAGGLPARGQEVPFTERVISTAADQPISVFATDVDGDGDTDVLSASFDDNKIAWYENLRPCGFDSDCDGDVDMRDFARFLELFTGPLPH